MNNNSAKRLALAAIGAAISLIAITLAYFVDAITLTFYAISAFGILIPLTKEYYKESILAVIAVSCLGAIYVNIQILPFVLVTGGYTVAAILIYNKNVRPVIYAPSLVVYSSLVFLVFYKLTSLFFIDFTKISILDTLSPVALYIILNSAFTLGAFAYHFGIIYAYKYLQPIVKRISK